MAVSPAIRIWALGLGACFLASVPATCGDAGTVGEGAGGDVGADGIAGDGEEPGPGGAIAPDPDPGVPGGQGDAAGDGTGTLDSSGKGGDGTDGGPEAGIFGALCGGPEDCFSGWCLPSPEGLVCSKTCAEVCPDGWDCLAVTDPAGSPAFVCVHRTALLCNPCLQHAECNQVPATSNLCVGDAAAGSFCAVSCEGDLPCPDGYSCTDVAGPGGGTARQCLPDAGACECNAYAPIAGTTSACQSVNEHGACPGTLSCPEAGPPACDAGIPSAETCDGEDDDCDGKTDEETGGAPCEVVSALGSCPGTTVCAAGLPLCVGDEATPETCDGVDEDCDGATDEGFPDGDADGIADCIDEDDDGDGFADGEDCGPLDASIHPGAAEHCDALDHDCDGKPGAEGALGCTDWYEDVDGDGFGSVEKPPKCLCAPDLVKFLSAGSAGDCNDLHTGVFPGADEVCNAKDEDCDGESDEGFPDTDLDGVADCVETDTDGDGVPDKQDCADADPEVHQGHVESCNVVDDDCDGLTDEVNALGCQFYLLDIDGDGQGSNSKPPKCLCAPEPDALFTALDAGDCNDLNPSVFAGAPESCNGVDDSCDGVTDEGQTDTDKDGVADCMDPDDDNDTFSDKDDCGPQDPTVNPAGLEKCNFVDDDCDGQLDEPGAKGCTKFYRDLDGDKYGSDKHPPLCLCLPDKETFYTQLVGGDCDDSDAAQHPGAAEACNFEDDDCDASTDEGVASPCKDCGDLCVLQLGAGGIAAFAPTPKNAENVFVTPAGHLALAATPGDGHYRHVWSGWPISDTSWDLVMVTLQGGKPVTSSVQVSWRSADSLEVLEVTPWSGPYGPYPPDTFPLEVAAPGAFLEVELVLNAAESGLGPVVQSLSVVASEVPP